MLILLGSCFCMSFSFSGLYFYVCISNIFKVSIIYRHLVISWDMETGPTSVEAARSSSRETKSEIVRVAPYLPSFDAHPLGLIVLLSFRFRAVQALILTQQSGFVGSLSSFTIMFLPIAHKASKTHYCFENPVKSKGSASRVFFVSPLLAIFLPLHHRFYIVSDLFLTTI